MKKVIWITGGSSGIGKAVALKFANKGWQVIISSRREEVLKDISDKNENIDYLKLDIVDYEACNSVFKTIVEKINTTPPEKIAGLTGDLTNMETLFNSFSLV